MEAVMLIEEIGPQGHPVLRQRFAGAGAECRIGRDLGCDIVVDDEHAAPQHALLTLLEDGRVNVRDLGTRNGTRVDGHRVPAETGANIEQGELIVGTHAAARAHAAHADRAGTRVPARLRAPAPDAARGRRRRGLRRLCRVSTSGSMRRSSLLPQRHDGALVGARRDRIVDGALGADLEAEQGPLGGSRPPDDCRRSAWPSAPGAIWVAGLLAYAAQWSRSPRWASPSWA